MGPENPAELELVRKAIKEGKTVTGCFEWNEKAATVFQLSHGPEAEYETVPLEMQPVPRTNRAARCTAIRNQSGSRRPRLRGHGRETPCATLRSGFSWPPRSWSVTGKGRGSRHGVNCGRPPPH
jgi:hypothetical protein